MRGRVNGSARAVNDALKGETSLPHEPKMAAADWVAHYARTQPHSVALCNYDTGETRTWAELERRVRRMAHALRHEFGVAPGERIVGLANGDIRFFELQFACVRAGVVLAPLNFRLAAPELAALCVDLAPKLMVTDNAWGDVAREVCSAAGVPRVTDWDEGQDFDQALARAGEISERYDLDPDAPLLILFTSGTTGRPKAAIVTFGGMVWQALNQVEFCFNAERNCHVFSPLPLFHAGGLNSLSNPILCFGGQVTVSARFDPAATTRFVGDPRNKVTHLGLVPLMYKMMAESAPFATADFSSIRTLLVAGGRLPETLRELYAAKGATFMTQYGGTETGPTITSMNGARLDKIRAGSCGQRAMFTQVRLVGAGGADVERGQPGEVWVRGPAVIRGYFGRDPSLDFHDGWFPTGDVAWEDDEGFFYIVDRVKDMYKSGGENVYPAEVEQVLLEHPGVEEIAIIGVPDEKWGEVGMAVVVASRGHTVTLESLRAICEGRLARFKQPKHLTLMEALPRNVTGKIAKEELRARFNGSRSA